MRTIHVKGQAIRFWQAGERDTRVDYAAVKISDNYESYFTTHTIDTRTDVEDICRAYIRGDGPGGGAVTVAILASRSRRYPAGSVWRLTWDDDIPGFCLSRVNN